MVCVQVVYGRKLPLAAFCLAKGALCLLHAHLHLRPTQHGAVLPNALYVCTVEPCFS
jgi:hypothetical protein